MNSFLTTSVCPESARTDCIVLGFMFFLPHILSFMKLGSSFYCYFRSSSLGLLPVFLAPHLHIFLQSVGCSWIYLLAGYWKSSSDLVGSVVAIAFVHVVVLHTLLHSAIILYSCIASQMLGISSACAVCQSMCSPCDVFIRLFNTSSTFWSAWGFCFVLFCFVLMDIVKIEP